MFRSLLSKASLKQISNLEDRMLKHHCFQLKLQLFLRILYLRLQWFFQGFVGQPLNNINYLLDGHLYSHSNIILELNGNQGQDKHGENDCQAHGDVLAGM